MAFSDWSTVDTDNATTSGISIPEGCPAANMNNWGRRIMSQLRAAIAPVWDSILSCTTLAQIRTALGVTEGTASQTAFAALTNTANSVPYMTGSDAWALATVTSFARTLLDDGDAATACATLGAVSITAASVSSAASGYVKLSILGSAFTLVWKQFTATADTTTAVTYPTIGGSAPFSSWSEAWVNHKNTDTDAQQNSATVTATTTSGATVTTAYSAATYSATLFAIGS
jgi:hypothetical protein